MKASAMYRRSEDSMRRAETILLVVALSLTLNPKAHTMSQDPRGEESCIAIRKLWSPDELKRELGKRKILELGSAPIAPLVALLSDLLVDQHPRFAAGKEEEATKALEEHLRSSPETISLDEFDRWSKRMPELFVNSRLISDALYLLGELRAEVAIPICIKIMEGRNMYSKAVGFGDEMVALSKIGSAAVPYLITAVKEARTRALKGEDIHLGFVIQRDAKNGAGDEEGESLKTKQQLQEEEEDLELRISKIRARAIRVLARIGDRSVLSFLDKFLIQTADNLLIEEINEAIDTIRRESVTRVDTRGGLTPKSKP